MKKTKHKHQYEIISNPITIPKEYQFAITQNEKIIVPNEITYDETQTIITLENITNAKIIIIPTIKGIKGKTPQDNQTRLIKAMTMTNINNEMKIPPEYIQKKTNPENQNTEINSLYDADFTVKKVQISDGQTLTHPFDNTVAVWARDNADKMTLRVMVVSGELRPCELQAELIYANMKSVAGSSLYSSDWLYDYDFDFGVAPGCHSCLLVDVDLLWRSVLFGAVNRLHVRFRYRFADGDVVRWRGWSGLLALRLNRLPSVPTGLRVVGRD